ncbi:hypothetical protein BN1708_013799 [Verticillium longisporum]|uniref:Uncharacterized protein n=1 Tax=Verticillium longisporum TaxID=100787 RepID=A0A0G4LQ48_VERLO|nr:hypothetical protein BN1708_013799 [Verticillium longisporum]
MNSSPHDRSPSRDGQTSRPPDTLAGVFALRGFADGLPPWAAHENDDARAKVLLGQRKYTVNRSSLEERIYVNLVVMFRALLHFSAMNHEIAIYHAVDRACSFATSHARQIRDLTKFYSARRKIYRRESDRGEKPTLLAALADEWCHLWSHAVNRAPVNERDEYALFDDKMAQWADLLQDVDLLLSPGFWPYSDDRSAPQRPEEHQLQREDANANKKHLLSSEDEAPDSASKRHCVESARATDSLPSPSDSRGRGHSSRDLTPARTERLPRIDEGTPQADRVQADHAGQDVSPEQPGETHHSTYKRDPPAEIDKIHSGLDGHLASKDALSEMAESHKARFQGLEASSTIAQAVAKNTEHSLALEELSTRLQDQINGHGARLDSLEGRQIHNAMSDDDAKRIETLEQRNRDLGKQLDDLRAQSSLSEAPSTARFNALQDQVSALARRVAESDSRAQAESTHIMEAEPTRQTQAELIETQSQHIAKLQQQIESNQRVIDLEPEFETVKDQLTEVRAAVEGKDILGRSLRDRLEHSLGFARAIHARDVFRTREQMLASADVVVQLERALQSLEKMKEL